MSYVLHMTHNLTRVESAATVERIAVANHVPFTRSRFAASVELGGVLYFWSAA